MRLKNMAIILAAIWLALSPVEVRAESVSVLAKQLICQCGCTSVLDNCTHVECMVREQMLGLLKAKVDKGQPEAEIMAAFVAQYGEKVLASPPKQGFNLTAWLTPFAAILAGGAVIYLAMRRWVWRGKAQAEAATGPPPEVDDEYEQRLKKELKEFPMRGFR